LVTTICGACYEIDYAASDYTEAGIGFLPGFALTITTKADRSDKITTAKGRMGMQYGLFAS
jgi:hypothetical protein